MKLFGQKGVRPNKTSLPNPPRPYVDPHKIGPESFCVSWDEHGQRQPCTLVPVRPKPLRPEDV